jgi:ribosomal protein S18 acetylase RimI-like enzyme
VPTEEQALQIADMYQAQGWWQPHDDGRECLIPRMIRGSHCFVIAVDGDIIVGMGRAISDGISDAYIQDLTVKKDRRKEGIGRKILLALLERLRADGISWIGLIAEPGSSDLYSHAGFRMMKESVPMLMTEET